MGASRLDFGTLPLRLLSRQTPRCPRYSGQKMRGEPLPPGSRLNTLASQFADARFVSRGIQTVKPSLDSVVLMTGQVIGPDTFDVIGESRARSAAVDEVVGKLSDTALSDADLAVWINSQLAKPA